MSVESVAIKSNNNTLNMARDLISRASLPLLALAASYGVFSFTSYFTPTVDLFGARVNVFAFLTASAFELVYIGLAVARDLTPEQKKRARLISYVAVCVSVLYNTLSGILETTIKFTDLDFYAKITLAAIHGIPLATLAFMVADLLLHTTTGEDLAALVDRLRDQLSTANTQVEKYRAHLDEVSRNHGADRDQLTSEITKRDQIIEDQNESYNLLLAERSRLLAENDRLHKLVESMKDQVASAKPVDIAVAAEKIKTQFRMIQKRTVSTAGASATGRPVGDKYGIDNADEDVYKILAESI